jgi:hypothetical protein
MKDDIFTITPVEPTPLALAMKELRDKFLTEAMGECWHEAGTKRVNPFTYVCTKCGSNIKKNSYNNFSTWEGFGKLWEWAQKQKWWGTFCSWLTIHKMKEVKHYSWIEQFIHPDRFANALYEYLKEVFNG